MAVLSIYLSPFAPDYSGVSSVLFDLKTVTAMHDASGCTGNYTGYDEPRWYGSKSPIFCSGLREIDAILGDDEKLIKKMIHAAEDLKPDVMALVGSPVPMVIGSDLTGIAAELEERTGIPSLGFDTTGTAYYDKGVAMATIALLKKFTPVLEMVPNTVNIVGASPLDFATGENLEDIKSLVQEAGYRITACLSMGYTMEDLKKASSAQINLAVSKAGLLIAEHMKKAYGIPYLCGLPVGEQMSRNYLETLRQVADTKESCIMKEATTIEDAGVLEVPGITKEADKRGTLVSSECAGNLEKSTATQSDILIIGEQVQSNAIRLALEHEYGKKNVAVGCLFGKDARLALPQDKNLSSERLIKEELNKGCYRMIIADPFMEQLLSKENKAKFCANAQYAVSSKVGVDDTARIIGSRFNEWFGEHR